MAQKLISIDIRDDVICGLMLVIAGKSVTVSKCGLSVPSGKESLVELVAEVLHHVEYTDEACRISLGAENFFFRNLSFPFHDKRKIDKILPIELEDTSIVDMEDVLVDSLVTGRKEGQSSVVAAMINRDFLAGRLDELASLGLDPEIVAISNVQTALQLSRQREDSSFVLLDAGCRRVTIYVMVEGRMRLVRTMVFDDGSKANFRIDKNSQQVSAERPGKIEETIAAMCAGIRHTLFVLSDLDPGLPLYLTGALADVPNSREILEEALGTAVLPLDLVQSSIKVGDGCGLWRADLMSGALALGIRSGRNQAGFNFRKDEFSRRISFERYRRLIPRLGIPVLLCIVIAMAYLWNDYTVREKKLLSLKERGNAIFAETLPEVQRIVDPVQQLKVEIREIRQGMLGDAVLQSDIKILDILAEISVYIPPSINVHVVRLVADRNGILIRGLTDNFNSVDGLKKALENSSYFATVTINSANLAARGTGIRFEIRLELNRG
ncbi:MAG: PilN domain-containing protein [Desulfopila sp.]|jgi:type II secretory pathway component PulL|nr:PilN domain-containing protein [Desulfopila sp.]